MKINIKISNFLGDWTGKRWKIVRKEREREESERTILVVKFHCDEPQKPSAEGQMCVGRTVLSKDMTEVLIARTSKHEKTQRAC